MKGNKDIMRNNSYYYDKKYEINHKELTNENSFFESFYELDSVNDTPMIAIPDGRVDIQCVWKGDRVFIVVCGSVESGSYSKVSNFDTCFCARFKIGVLPKSIKDNLKQIVGNRVPLDSIFEITKLEHYMKRDLSIEKKAEIMLELFHTSIPSENEYFVEYIIDEIEKQKGCISVHDIIKNSGYSHRYANYVFKNNVGCSIKKFSSIVRLQESFKLLLEAKDDAIYNELGYYDQSHFIKDFKNFAVVTPNRIKKMADRVIFV